MPVLLCRGDATAIPTILVCIYGIRLILIILTFTSFLQFFLFTCVLHNSSISVTYYL